MKTSKNFYSHKIKTLFFFAHIFILYSLPQVFTQYDLSTENLKVIWYLRYIKMIYYNNFENLSYIRGFLTLSKTKKGEMQQRFACLNVPLIISNFMYVYFYMIYSLKLDLFTFSLLSSFLLTFIPKIIKYFTLNI